LHEIEVLVSLREMGCVLAVDHLDAEQAGRLVFEEPFQELRDGP
jgi:hypothetical protein